MAMLFFPFVYVRWAYGDGIGAFFHAWKNIHWFLYHYFSTPLLITTLLQPWHRMHERKTKGFDIGEFLQRIVINTILRLIGFFARVVVLCVSIIAHIVALVFAIWLFVIFLFAPVVIPLFFIVGTVMLINAL